MLPINKRKERKKKRRKEAIKQFEMSALRCAVFIAARQTTNISLENFD